MNPKGWKMGNKEEMVDWHLRHVDLEALAVRNNGAHGVRVGEAAWWDVERMITVYTYLSPNVILISFVFSIEPKPLSA